MKTKKSGMTSLFADRLENYLKFMHGLGRVYRVEESILRAFDRYVVEKCHLGLLTQTLVIGFVYSRPDLSSVQYCKRYRILIRFSDYLRAFEPDTMPLDSKAVVAKPERHLAHIYTVDEISRLLQEAKQLKPISSLRPLTYFTFLGLLVSTGLRVGEALKLDRTDVDLNDGILQIRESKFRKSRFVPVHFTTKEVLGGYADARNQIFPGAVSHSFFLNGRGKRLKYSTVLATFLNIVRKTGIRGEQGRGPRLHDLRHSFAVKRVLAWYDAGEDVQLRLPELATYMGHAHFENTVYYLTAGSELMNKASLRFNKYEGDKR